MIKSGEHSSRNTALFFNDSRLQIENNQRKQYDINVKNNKKLILKTDTLAETASNVLTAEESLSTRSLMKKRYSDCSC